MSPALPAPGRHGGDGPAVAVALGIDPGDLVDLSQTLNPFAPDVAALATRHLGSLRRYPDPSTARRLLAEALGVDGNAVLVTNGGSEAIGLVEDELGGTVRSEPEFALHPRAGHGPRWRSDPHNPTGTLAAADEHADVWDEAFYAMATGRWTSERDALRLGSLTKLFACPGLRLGYVVGEPELIERLAARQATWSVNSLALAMLPELLDRVDLRGWQRHIAEARNELVSILSQHGLVAHAADAPWVLVEAPDLRRLLAPQGILVRDCTSFGMPRTARIAVCGPRELRRLDTALGRMRAT